MEKANLLKKSIIAALFLFFLAILSADAKALNKCPDEKTLTRDARIALVEAQKQIGKNKPADARDTLLKFIRDYPDENHVYVTYTLAGLFFEETRLSKALALYQKAIDMCPSYAPAWQNMGKICFDLQKFNQAALAMEKTFELTGKKKYILLFHAAVAHLSDKNPKKALTHIHFLTSGKAGTPKPNWVKLMVNLSIEQNQARKAIKTIENLLEQKKPDPYLFRLAATLYLHINKYRDAAKALSVYGLVTPLTIAEQTLLADLYNNLEIPFKAARLYEKIIEKKPDKKIYKRLASAWLEACTPEKALDAVQKGLDIYPDLHTLWKLKGWIHYENKAFRKASKAFSKAFVLKKTDSKSLFMHGLCASKAGLHDIAKKILRKAACHAQYKQQALALLRQIEHAADKS